MAVMAMRLVSVAAAVADAVPEAAGAGCFLAVQSPESSLHGQPLILNADLHIILSVIRLAPLIHAKEHTRKMP